MMIASVEAESIPPVTETEFRELAAWFAANDERLYRLSMSGELLDVGGGRQTSCAELRYCLAQGQVELGRLRAEIAEAMEANAAAPDEYDSSKAETCDFTDLLKAAG